MSFGIWVCIVAIFILLVCSAFLAAAETALTGASKARLHALAQKDNLRAQEVNAIRSDAESMIGTLMLANNLVNILSSALATGILIRLTGEEGVLYATAVMTVMIVIFAEVLPKTYALYHADQTAMAISPVVRLIIFILSPFSKIISGIVRIILKMMGTDISSPVDAANMEEIRGAIDLHQDPEDETQEQRAMLHSILDLDDVWVGEIMIHRRNMAAIDLDRPMESIVDEILNSRFTRIPVWKETPDNIVGILHAKDLLRELRKTNGDIHGVDIGKLISQPWYIPDTTPLIDQLRAFQERREHFALVVDEYGALMGMVTLEDILEEIVGNIDDKHDATVAGVRRQPNGGYMIDGTVTIRDLNREFGWGLPGEHYSTLAGLIIYEAKKIPNRGESFYFYDFRFEVIRRQRNQVTLVRVLPQPPKEGEHLERA